MNTKKLYNFSIPHLEELVVEIRALRMDVKELKEKIHPQQEWYSLKQACALKGINYNSINNN